ncbi:cytochrome P450 [Mycobacterium simiae]|uniref:Cytochrome P450 n=1 Tax=Mycobacterium simiae TaxID=1784 RepID=A0A5B1BSY7_MYCSI|nr:cytochrome P450 [Mycobacterium simiae]
MATGQTVLVVIAAANRDPAVFDEPDQFRPGRGPAPLAFGYGAHYCLGAALARLEITTAFQQFARQALAAIRDFARAAG